MSVFSDNDEIFICQCTTEWKIDKVTELVDIYQEFKSRLSHNKIQAKINSVIFTKVERSMISQTIKEAEELNMKVMSVEDLLNLSNEIRNNKEPFREAKQMLSL